MQLCTLGVEYVLLTRWQPSARKRLHLMKIPLFINNGAVYSSKRYNVRSAVNNDVIRSVSAVDKELLNHAISSAHAVLADWRSSPVKYRQKIFNKAADLLEERSAEFTTLMETEMPCHSGYSAFNVSTTVATFRELSASMSTAARAEYIPIDNGAHALVFREPYGVCLAMAPWNAAMILAARAFATPIIAGNTVVLKTSELSPGTHNMFGQLMKDAGLPDGVLNIINVAVEDVSTYTETLISDKRIRHVNFTGSTRVGSIIGSLAGKYMKPAILELGGKSPVIVLADADLELAVSHSILGAWMHQGQICMSTEKVIVVESVYDEFVALARKMALESGMINSPLGQASQTGAIKAKQLIEEAIGDGATLLLGPHVPLRDNYMAPCILTDVKHSMKIYSEETFAAVFMIMRAENEDKAIELANDTEYGLSSSIFTKDVERAIELGRMVEAGATHINSMTIADHPSIPHGGMKSSGYGRFNGVEGIRAFTQTKIVSIHGQAQAIPL